MREGERHLRASEDAGSQVSIQALRYAKQYNSVSSGRMKRRLETEGVWLLAHTDGQHAAAAEQEQRLASRVC